MEWEKIENYKEEAGEEAQEQEGEQLLLWTPNNGAERGFLYNGRWMDLRLEYQINPSHFMRITKPKE